MNENFQREIKSTTSSIVQICVPAAQSTSAILIVIDEISDQIRHKNLILYNYPERADLTAEKHLSFPSVHQFFTSV